MKLIIFLGLVAAVLGDDATLALQRFRYIDRNNDGIILVNEMVTGFNSEDKDGDGFLNLEEFTAGIHPGSPPLDIEDAFDYFDKRDDQEDGKLDRSAVVVLFNGLDTDENGEISMEEFINKYIKLFTD